MFTPNDIIICVDRNVNYAANDGRTDGLTIGKQYQIKFIKHKYTYELVYIINDHNVLGNYYGYRFITLTEYRKQKLNKICSKLETM